jgi:hypothetical protein
MNAAQQGTPADVTKFAYANLAPRLSLGVIRPEGIRPKIDSDKGARFVAILVLLDARMS